MSGEGHPPLGGFPSRSAKKPMTLRQLRPNLPQKTLKQQEALKKQQEALKKQQEALKKQQEALKKQQEEALKEIAKAFDAINGPKITRCVARCADGVRVPCQLCETCLEYVCKTCVSDLNGTCRHKVPAASCIDSAKEFACHACDVVVKFICAKIAGLAKPEPIRTGDKTTITIDGESIDVSFTSAKCRDGAIDINIDTAAVSIKPWRSATEVYELTIDGGPKTVATAAGDFYERILAGIVATNKKTLQDEETARTAAEKKRIRKLVKQKKREDDEAARVAEESRQEIARKVGVRSAFLKIRIKVESNRKKMPSTPKKPNLSISEENTNATSSHRNTLRSSSPEMVIAKAEPNVGKEVPIAEMLHRVPAPTVDILHTETGQSPQGLVAADYTPEPHGAPSDRAMEIEAGTVASPTADLTINENDLHEAQTRYTDIEVAPTTADFIEAKDKEPVNEDPEDEEPEF